MQLDEVNIEGLSPGGVVLAGAHACGQSSTCSSTKIGCASLSFPSPPTPVGFVFPSVFARGLATLSSIMRCIAGYASMV